MPYFEQCDGIVESFQLTYTGADSRGWEPSNPLRPSRISVLVKVDLDMKITYIDASFENRRHGAKALLDAKRSGLNVPAGKYVLASSDHGGSAIALTPYLDVEFPVKSEGIDSHTPQNKEELFNLRHAQLSTIAHKAFQVLHMRFQVLKFGRANQYSRIVQTRLLYTLSGLHNWIIFGQLPDLLVHRNGNFLDLGPHESLPRGAERNGCSRRKAIDFVAEQRDDIAGCMWRDFQAHTHT